MSEVQSIGAAGAVRASIARAANSTGVDFDYLLAQAKIESSLNPQARAGTSSAAGLYQFVGSTWLDTLDKHGAEHGLGWAASAAADPAARAKALALRFDPDASALMAAELASDNKAALVGVLGRDPDPAELYLAHFLGAEGASRFLSALAADPGQSAAALMPKAAAANRGIFYDDAGGARSLGQVMDMMRGKMARAMEGPEAAQWALANAGEADPAAFAAPSALAAASAPTGGPIARAFYSAAAAQPSPQAAPSSMAETLRQTFALGSPAASAVPDHVRSAYARLSALGL